MADSEFCQNIYIFKVLLKNSYVVFAYMGARVECTLILFSYKTKKSTGV